MGICVVRCLPLTNPFHSFFDWFAKHHCIFTQYVSLKNIFVACRFSACEANPTYQFWCKNGGKMASYNYNWSRSHSQSFPIVNTDQTFQLRQAERIWRAEYPRVSQLSSVSFLRLLERIWMATRKQSLLWPSYTIYNLYCNYFIL